MSEAEKWRMRQEIDRLGLENSVLAGQCAGSTESVIRLRELLAAFNARYRCECKHNRCKRCELNRQADELLGGDQ